MGKRRAWLAGVGILAGAILAVAGGRVRVRAANTVTFSEDIAPIVFTRCTSCHRPGEAAPFALQSYGDVKRHGTLIAAAVGSHTMPPWKAGPSDYAFKSDRRLTDAQIDLIQRWVSAGMPEGDPKKLPAMPAFTEGWQLGQPDLVVSMPDAFEVPASGPDLYRNFVLPLNLAEDRWVRAIAFRPSARSVVHHSLFFLDGTGSARAQDAQDPQPGFAGTMGGFSGARGNLARLFLGGGRGGRRQPEPDDMAETSRAAAGLGGYALGAPPKALPDGLAYFIPKGSDLVLSTHFHPSGKSEREASVVGLYFADGPPREPFAGVQLPPVFGVLEGIDIKPGDKAYTIKDSWTLPVDVKAFNVGAHAHYLAKRMLLTATLPDGTTRTLLNITDWDFAWQEQYQFAEFVTLPKGTRLDATIVYDNSAANPHNPSSPPARVTWGEQSTDEMGSLGIQFVAAHAGDLQVLQRAYAMHLREAALTRPGLQQLMQQRRLR